MKVLLKSKIDQKGYLCICVIDSEFHQNDSEINLSAYRKTIQIPSLKLCRFYKTINVKEDVIKQNELDNKCREKVSNYLNGVYQDLKESGMVITGTEIKFSYKQVVQPQKKDRNSCTLMNCF